MTNLFKHILSVIIVALFLFVAIGTGEKDSNKSEEVVKELPKNISAVKLYQDYEENEVSADNQYKGKMLKVTGEINSIGKDMMDNVYVTLKGNEYIGDIQCFFEDENKSSASSLSKGETVTIVGKCDGKIITNVILKNCEIE